jgi:hypothetical protein
MIGKLLGHSQAQTTHRYAHLAADLIIRANERVGAAILSAMSRGTDNLGGLRTGQPLKMLR